MSARAVRRAGWSELQIVGATEECIPRLIGVAADVAADRRMIEVG